jgi:hypothetical protein
MVVQKFGQLLAQALVLFPLMTEHDGALEQRVLQLVRQFAPKIGSGRSEHEQITGSDIVDDLIGLIHDPSQKYLQFHAPTANGKQTMRGRKGFVQARNM